MRKLVKVGLLVPVLVVLAFASVSAFAADENTERGKLTGETTSVARTDARTDADSEATETAGVEQEVFARGAGRVESERRGRSLTRGRVVVSNDGFMAQGGSSSSDDGSQASAGSVGSDSSDKSGKSDSSGEVSPGDSSS